ncbi:MAG TPA: type II toxin-antitoxin system RelE/ParE family toxin [Flavobacteriales bacterium]|jgi:toxin ParE1/3/4|nr:type II toxin-antitoxin system RelE/ParE family toxin [Flavobacteriales bacterium]HIB83437.1 type II toxin-antitoxin system RelE/ParE family toxin [Chromatiaceae bacterium]
MTIKYRLRSLAQADLESIWLYTRDQWGLTQADFYLKALIQRFDWLTENPALGKSRDDVKQGYFCFPQGRHLIFYILKNNQVEIIGIPHQRMDVVEYLS